MSIRWTDADLASYKARQGAAEMRGVDIDAVHRKFTHTQAHKESKLERRFDQKLLEADLPPAQKNWFFMDDRDFELDRAWPQQKVAVEIQGMAHRIKGKWKRDIEKRALAMLAGWRVLEVDGATIKDGRAIAWLKELLK